MFKAGRRDLLQIIKKIASDTFHAEKPADFTVGEVVSNSPLQIKVEGGSILPAVFFVLSQSVTKHTDKRGQVIDNHLETGDQVILAEKLGGQKFYVLNKVGDLS